MLKLGNRLLDLEIARVCKINPEAETNTFLHVEAPESYNINKGKIIPLGKSFCNITFSSDEEGKNALDANGNELAGRKLNVNTAKDNRDGDRGGR